MNGLLTVTTVSPEAVNPWVDRMLKIQDTTVTLHWLQILRNLHLSLVLVPKMSNDMRTTNKHLSLRLRRAAVRRPF